MATMKLIDELTIETSDYEFRKSTNALRKWKYDMFLVNQAFKNRQHISPHIATGNCYSKKYYINKITELFFNQSQHFQKEKYATTASAEYIRKVFFEVNDGKDMAECVFTKPIPYDRFSQYETQYNKFSPEIQETIRTEFLQLLNSILIGTLKTEELEQWALDDCGRALNAEGNDYKIKVKRTRFDKFWSELANWYFWNGKFYRFYQYDDNNDIPINPKTEKPFTIKYTMGGRAEINDVMECRNLKTMLKRSIFSTEKRKRSAFFSINVRRKVRTMDYKQSHISFYDINNAKKFNDKGQASSKGLQANHLYTYHTDTHSRGWTFGGITAGNMETFVRENGYIGKKMTYQECINWILKDMDFQDFTNRTPPEPKTKASKSKKAK